MYVLADLNSYSKPIDCFFALFLDEIEDILIRDINVSESNPANIRLHEDVFNNLHQDEYIRLTHTSSEVFKTSSRRLDQDQYTCLGYKSSRRLQDVLKTSSRRPQDVFKTSSRRLQDVLKPSSRRLQNVFVASSRRLQDILKTSSRRFQEV